MQGDLRTLRARRNGQVPDAATELDRARISYDSGKRDGRTDAGSEYWYERLRRTLADQRFDAHYFAGYVVGMAGRLKELKP